MSKAPGALESYTGDGDWFKIGSVVAKNDKQWATTNQSSVIVFSTRSLLSHCSKKPPKLT